MTNAHVRARLCVLSSIGLAERASDGAWLLRSDTEQVLRECDRQTPSVEGRVLMHGEDEHSGMRFMMLETTSARVFYIPYTREMDDIRARGGLKANSFVRFRRLGLEMQIESFGNSEQALSNRPLLREKVEELRKRGLEPTEDGWGGWLGRYQKALCETAQWRSTKDRSRRNEQKVGRTLSSRDR